MGAAGELIAGRYRLAGEIGRGGMGVVWRAQDELLDRVVAIKQLLPGNPGGDMDDAVEKARREGRIAGRLQHPNVITVHDVFVHAGRPCLVMDYMASRSFAEVIAAQGRVPVHQVVEVAEKVASALAAAHLAGIVHQDVKPENVLIGLDGKVKITDFGLSRAIGEGSTTRAGFVAGTPGFLAPEVASGAEMDNSADVFALGATMYAAIEGAPPYGHHDDNTVILMRAARGEIIPPRHAGELTPVLMALLAVDPKKRPTMLQVRDELRAREIPRDGTIELKLRKIANQAGGVALAEAPSIPIRPVGAPSPVGDRAEMVRRRRVTGLAVAILTALVVLFGVLLVVSDDSGGTRVAPGARGVPAGDAGVRCQPAIVETFPGPDGQEVTVEVWNLAGAPVDGWRVSWTFPDTRTVRTVTGGQLSQEVSGSDVLVTVDSPTAIPARGSVRFGFVVGDGQGLDGLRMRCEARAG
ncbi:MAG: protein kinase [Kibdelosporangium sp.]